MMRTSKTWFTFATPINVLVIIFCIEITSGLAGSAASDYLNLRKVDISDENTSASDEAEKQSSEEIVDTSKSSGQNQPYLELESSSKSAETVKLLDDLTLKCEVGGSPPPAVSWLKNGRRIDNILTHDSDDKWSHKVEVEVRSARQDDTKGFVMSTVVSKLFLPCISPEDEGQYTCVAQNIAKRLEVNIDVNIKDNSKHDAIRQECKYKSHGKLQIRLKNLHSVPYILTSETLHIEPIGHDVVLPCAAAGFPKPAITWYDPEGNDISSNYKYQVSMTGSLLIRQVTWDDMGEYTCQAENRVGSEMAVTFLYPLSQK